MSNRGATRAVMEYLARNARRPVSSDRIADDLGIPKTVVNSALSHLAKSSVSGISRVNWGVYRFDPGSPADNQGARPGDVYECVGRDAHGGILVRSEEGIIYKLTEI